MNGLWLNQKMLTHVMWYVYYLLLSNMICFWLSYQVSGIPGLQERPFFPFAPPLPYVCSWTWEIHFLTPWHVHEANQRKCRVSFMFTKYCKFFWLIDCDSFSSNWSLMISFCSFCEGAKLLIGQSHSSASNMWEWR